MTKAVDTDRFRLSDEHDVGDPCMHCECCGKPVRVFVLEGYADGRPHHRRFCLECADTPAAKKLMVRPAKQKRTSIFSILGVVGGAFALAGMFGDSVLGEAGVGFGWYQGIGVAIGGLVIFMGALLRSDLIALCGTFLFVGALCADWFGWVATPGLGLTQQLLLVMSVVLLGLPLFQRVFKSIFLSRASSSG